MKVHLFLSLGLGFVLTAGGAHAQNVLFDFSNGPQYSGTPLDQFSDGIGAYFWGPNEDLYHPAYSIQDTAYVIGMYPAGFSGLGLSPDSVYGSDLLISFFRQSDGSALDLTDLSIMVAPQELACDSSSMMEIMAYEGSVLVGSNTAIGYSDQAYTWPTILLNFTSTKPFDNVAIHFLSGPPTGGDWGGIFVADNLRVTPSSSSVPGPAAALAAMISGLVGLLHRCRKV